MSSKKSEFSARFWGVNAIGNCQTHVEGHYGRLLVGKQIRIIYVHWCTVWNTKKSKFLKESKVCNLNII